jgi:hypothetical protein
MIPPIFFLSSSAEQTKGEDKELKELRELCGLEAIGGHMEVKEHDVFRFSYNDEAAKKRFDPYHCFDGQLIALKHVDGIRLVDTYWSDNTGGSFTIEEALSQGTLTFVCNLQDVEKANEDVGKYYDDTDWFNLSRQHGCYKEFAVRKGAKRSAAKMEESLKAQINDLDHDIQRKREQKERAERFLEQVKNGNLEGVYI